MCKATAGTKHLHGTDPAHAVAQHGVGTDAAKPVTAWTEDGAASSWGMLVLGSLLEDTGNSGEGRGSAGAGSFVLPVMRDWDGAMANSPCPGEP